MTEINGELQISKYTEHAQTLRDDTSLHYNCAQSVLIPFAEEMGLTKEQAFDLGLTISDFYRKITKT